MSSVWSRILFCSLFVVMGLGQGVIMAQTSNLDIRPKLNSPYSRFGIGELHNQYFVAANGIGGLSAAFQDPFHLNLRNPASLAWLEATAFEVGFNAKYSNLKGGNENQGAWSGNLDYLALGFPLSNPINEAMERRQQPVGVGMSFVLQPYSVVGYDVIADLEGDGAGPSVNSFKGTGGTYRLLWGNAVRWKGISAGFNLGYLFGKITNSRRVEFQEQPFAYASEFLDEVSLNGWMWEFGAQYAYDFMEVNDEGEREASGKRLILGVFGNGTNSFNTEKSSFISRDSRLFGNRDTIFYESGTEQSGRLPGQLGVGVTYEEVNRLKIGIEYDLGMWSQYENEAKPENLSDGMGLRFGVEYIPDYSSFNNYFEKLRYRFGGIYRNDPRNFEEGQLKQYALTLGLGFPVIRPRQQTSFINFALEVGRFGHPDLIQETYVRMALGFTLNDNTWFFKRKFN